MGKGEKGGERERERDRETGKEREKERDRQTDIGRERVRDREWERGKETERERESGRDHRGGGGGLDGDREMMKEKTKDRGEEGRIRRI